MTVRIPMLTLATTLLVSTPVAAAGKCDLGGVHGAAVAAARRAVRSTCDCDGAAGRAAYLSCAWETIQRLVDAGELPRMCRGRVRQFAARSTCGRDGMVACCVTTARGLWRPAIRTSAAGCTPPRNGEACTAHFPNLEDACSPDTGCSTSLCGNGVVDPDEECDGQSACGPDCRLARVACCDFTFPGGGAACFGRTEYQDGDVYTSVGKPCVTTLFGTSSSGICGDGPPCPDPAPPELGCRLASCTDQPIDPLPLCCEQAAGGCRDTVATTAGAIGDFGCSTFPPPEEGEVDRLLVGTCGDDGRCVPAS